MKWLAILALASLGASTIHAAEADKGLKVHEWGVFRVNQDADFANAELRAEWDSLPGFVYGYIKGRVVPQHWGAVEIRLRPLLFFHASQPAQVHVRIDFPGGMPGVWYPATSNPSIEGNGKQPRIGSSLEWQIGVKTPPNGWRPRTPTPAEVENDNWFAKARRVKCDEIFAKFGPNWNDVEREKFIYYDGIFPYARWMQIKVEKDRVALTSEVKHPIYDVTVVDRRGEKVRVGRIAKLDVGETVKEVAFTDSDASRFPSEAANTLLKQLVAAGLFEDEAKSLVDTWKNRMFETPGLSLYYRLPQEVYDALMPLTLTPKADSVVRVGLIYHGHLEADFADRILELVKQLDAPRFADRDAAMKKLIAIGPAAAVQVQKLRARRDLSVEVRERIDALMKKWSSKEAFDE